MQQAFSGMFPIAEWEKGELRQDDHSTIDLKRQPPPGDQELSETGRQRGAGGAHHPQAHNQTTIGALSWLAAQTSKARPAAWGVDEPEEAEAPSFLDVKETNAVVRLARRARTRP